MPAIGLLFFINAILIIHAARKGYFWPWAYVIFMLPGVSAAAYFLLIVLADYRSTAMVGRAQIQVARMANPERTYRALKGDLETADTFSTRRSLAQECLSLGKNDEALRLFDDIVASPLGDEPAYRLGKAQAEFALHDFAATLATLDAMQRQWPSFTSQEGHLLYARSLDGLGRTDEALTEYLSLARYATDREGQMRCVWLLERLGRQEEAATLAQEVVRHIKQSPTFVRRQQRQWLTAAKIYLRGIRKT